jgi:hypothetical protein
MRLRLLAALSIAVGLGWATSSSATTVNVVYTGIITTGFDQTGVFGEPDRSLSGDSYSLDFVFNTALGIAVDNSMTKSATGGSEYGVPSPALSVLATINGHSATVPLSYSGTISATQFGADVQQYHGVYYLNTDGGIYTSDQFYAGVYSANVPFSIDAPFSYTVQPGDADFGLITLYEQDNNTGTQLIYVSANLTVSTLTVAVVPEAPTWVMLVIGFAAAGYASMSAGARPGRRSAATSAS